MPVQSTSQGGDGPDGDGQEGSEATTTSAARAQRAGALGADDTVDVIGPSSAPGGAAPRAVNGAEPPREGHASSGAATLPAYEAVTVPRPDLTTLVTVDPTHYVRGGPVARGGMGRIVAARDRRLGRIVAIKELLPGRSDARERFELEARITARLQHPSIVSVLEAGTWPDGEPFYAMTLIAGRPLDQEVAARPSLAERLELLPRMIAVADAMAYAHSQRIIHRDIKPANVLVGEFGETVVIDWGLAKDLAAHPGGPRLPSRKMAAVDTPVRGMVVGTPAYMPPEQARGEVVDERADVYSLGAVLYHVLAGHPPYDGKKPQKVLESVISGEPAPEDLGALGCPRDLRTIIAKAMARDREQRYPTARQLAQDLLRFQTGQLVAARQYSTAAILARWIGRHRAPLAVALVAAVALATLGAISLRRIVIERAAAVAGRREAVRQRGVAEAARDELYGEQARRESLAGHSGAALGYLLAAGPLVARTPWLAFLVQENLRAFHAQEQAIPEHGTQAVGFADFSPDGKRLLSAGVDGKVVISGPGSGATKKVLAHRDAVKAALWADDGHAIVSGSYDGLVRVWDADTYVVRRTLDARAGRLRVLALASVADASKLVALYDDGTARIWHVPRDAQPEPPLVLKAPADITDVAISPDGTRVATAEADGTVGLWSAASGARLRGLPGSAGDAVRTVRFAPPAPLRLVSAADDGTTRIWDGTSGELVAKLEGHHDDVFAAAFSTDGTRVVTASLDRTAVIWDAATGERLHVLGGHEDVLYDAAFSVDGRLVVTASADETARVWDAETGFELARFEGHRGPVRSARFSINATSVVTAGDDGSVRVWRYKRSYETIAHASAVTAAAFAAAGSVIASASSDGGLWVRRLPDPTVGPVQLATPAVANALVWAADGKLLAGCADGKLRSWDARGGGAQEYGDPGPAVRALAADAGERVAIGRDDGSLELWRRSGTLPEWSTRLDADVAALAFAPDGSTLWVAADRRVRAYDPASGKPRPELDLPTQRGFVESLAVARDGKHLATVALASLTLWTLHPGAPPSPSPAVPGQGGRLYSVGFSPDGQLLATGSADGTVEIWGVEADAARSLALRHQPGALTSVSFSPDGHWLAAASDDGSLRLWNVQVDMRLVTELAELARLYGPWPLPSRGGTR